MKKIVAILLITLTGLFLLPLPANAAYADSESKAVPMAVIIIASLLIALLVCSAFKSKMKTAKIAKTAENYIRQDGVRLTVRDDIFMYQTVTRKKIERSSSSSSGSNTKSGGK